MLLLSMFSSVTCVPMAKTRGRAECVNKQGVADPGRADICALITMEFAAEVLGMRIWRMGRFALGDEKS